MSEYKLFEGQRKLKQLFMGVLFLIILVGGWFYPLLGYFIPLCMLLGMGMGFFRGRKWCDWFCPRGSFFDSFVASISPKRGIPLLFKGLPVCVGVLSFLMLMMAVQIIKRWPDPYKIGAFFVTLLTATTILGIILSLIFHQRTWCCFCPIGSMAKWVGGRRNPLRIDSGLCTECEFCYKVCPIQIAPFKFKKTGLETVEDRDCLKCNLCVSACPKKALKFEGGQV